MPVIRRRNQHSIYILIIENPPEVFFRCRGKFLYIFDFLDPLGKKIGVDITERLDRYIGNLRETLRQIHSPAPDPDYRYINAVISPDDTTAMPMAQRFASHMKQAFPPQSPLP